MSESIILYTHPRSRGRVVRWLLEELEVPYQVEVIQFGEMMHSRPYLDINPMGKVPALSDNGVIITETSAICAYLADKYPEKALVPEDRGTYYRWLFFIAGPVEAAFFDKMLGFEVPKEREVSAIYGSMERMLETLEEALRKNQYIAGDQFSVADLYLSAMLTWQMAQGGLPKRSPFTEYCEHIHQRPAYKRAAEKDDTLLASLTGQAN